MDIASNLIDELKCLPIPKLIGVSGFGGAGKSSIAKVLGDALGASVVSVDSFQKRGAFDTKYTLWKIMDYDRLEKEVLLPFLYGDKTISYGHFDASQEMISNTIKFDNEGVLIVEGVGLFRPELMKYFTYTIWVDCTLEEAIERGKTRDKEEYNNPNDTLWDGMWKQNDIQYFEKFSPDKNASVVIRNL